MFYRLLLIAIVLGLFTPVQATMMRLDFSGTIVGAYPFDGGPPVGEFSGYYLLDTSAPDINDSSLFGRFGQAVVGGELNWNGLDLDLSTGAINVGVNNDTGDVFYDLFFILSTDFDGLTFLFQLGDETEAAFFDDSFPTELNLTDFDPLEIDNVNSTGVFIILDSGSFQGSVDYINYRPVPLPGALILLSSGLLGMAAYSRSRDKIVPADC